MKTIPADIVGRTTACEDSSGNFRGTRPPWHVAQKCLALEWRRRLAPGFVATHQNENVDDNHPGKGVHGICGRVPAVKLSNTLLDP